MSYAGPGLSPRHLEAFVIRPVLAHLAGTDAPGIDRDAAVELLLGTAAHESGLRALDQITSPTDRSLGPAFGLFQIEPRTHADLWTNFLGHRPALAARVAALRSAWPSGDVQLATNLAYAAAIARLVYFRSPVPLAAPGDVAGHAAVWKRVYNTTAGKGRPEQFVDAWSRLVQPYR
ncbi:hypothetical protein HL658_31285 [Azospirillum sp. RWY-5-1]|uniref:Transglycosylase SLT domain-containing protein n=1 Tax=Azospirillum oleiclasticum TaxID=2735135 RepID=A0ABX2TKE4_9PROT|nr:hypothetical protein [Azospirillum oleiclasticum]NYZ17049.1 hypothetical protein [Azospirillum oleiclasticum]NYZ24507.1 hypothetical protein [Azospirillum oleiclasticum]